MTDFFHSRIPDGKWWRFYPRAETPGGGISGERIAMGLGGFPTIITTITVASVEPFIYIYIYGTSIHSRTRVLQSPVPWNKDGIWSLQYGLPGKPDNWVWEEWNRIPSEAPGWGRVDHWWESWVPWSLPQVHHQWLGEQDHSVDPDKGTKRNVEAGTEDQRLHGI